MEDTTTYEVWFRRVDGSVGSTAYTQFRTPRRPREIAAYLNRPDKGVAERAYFVARATTRRTLLEAP